MKSRNAALVTFAITLFLFVGQLAFAQERQSVGVAAEMGMLKVWHNKYQAGKTGTTFDFVKSGAQEVLKPFYRFSADYSASETHSFTFLYNPLRLQDNVVLRNDLKVNSVVFPAGTPIEALYEFGFYRLSYLYSFSDFRKDGLSLGASLQIRNAEIGFRSLDGKLVEYSRNIGPVPLIKVMYDARFGERMFFTTEVDGMYAAVKVLNGSDSDVVGSIVDANVRFGIETNTRHRYFINARLLGGGARGTSSSPEFGSDGYSNNTLWTSSLTLGAALLR